MHPCTLIAPTVLLLPTPSARGLHFSSAMGHKAYSKLHHRCTWSWFTVQFSQNDIRCESLPCIYLLIPHVSTSQYSKFWANTVLFGGRFNTSLMDGATVLTSTPGNQLDWPKSGSVLASTPQNPNYCEVRWEGRLYWALIAMLWDLNSHLCSCSGSSFLPMYWATS